MTQREQLTEKLLDTLLEVGADLEHDRWARWQKYLHSLCVKNEDGSLTIPATRVTHWQRQIETPYQDLTEVEKEWDRKEVSKYFPLITQVLLTMSQKTEEALMVEKYIAVVTEEVGSEFATPRHYRNYGYNECLQAQQQKAIEWRGEVK